MGGTGGSPHHDFVPLHQGLVPLPQKFPENNTKNDSLLFSNNSLLLKIPISQPPTENPAAWCIMVDMTRNTIDDYDKDGDQGRSDFYEVFTMRLCALGLKQLLISLLFLKSYSFDIRCACSQKLFEANL